MNQAPYKIFYSLKEKNLKKRKYIPLSEMLNNSIVVWNRFRLPGCFVYLYRDGKLYECSDYNYNPNGFDISSFPFENDDLFTAVGRWTDEPFSVTDLRIIP